MNLYSIIQEQGKTIRALKRCLWYMLFIWLLSWASCAAVLISGKLPLIEINIKQPNFGSVYPDE